MIYGLAVFATGNATPLTYGVGISCILSGFLWSVFSLSSVYIMMKVFYFTRKRPQGS